MNEIFKIVKDTNKSIREKSSNIDLPLSTEIEQLGLEMLQYLKNSQDEEFLEKHPDPQRIVIGFDDLERNLSSLRKGHIEYLVTRHIPQQSFKVMTEFAECIIKGISPSRRNNYVHMDILHKRNLDDY